MPGLIIDAGAIVICAHGGRAQAVDPGRRVLVSGQPAVTQSAPWVVFGCSFVPPAGNGPCLTANWVSGASRVLAGGQPVLLQDSQAVCVPTGTPLRVVVTQIRVRAT
jgi:hypothetical protein